MILTFTCLFLYSAPAFAGLIFISNVYVEASPGCESGFLFTTRPPNAVEVYCIVETKEFHPNLWQDQEIKVGFKVTTFGNKKKGKAAHAKIVIRDPPQEVGTNIDNPGFLGAVGAVATAYNESQGISAPSATPTPPAQQGQSTGGTYVPGLNNCITAYFDQTYYNFYTYKNQCTQKINVKFVNANGNGGSVDLEAGGHGATGDTPENLKKIGNYEFYACPYHYVAVDGNGQQFTHPVASFKCASAGY